MVHPTRVRVVGISEWKRGSRTGANGRWAAAAGTFVELAASALVEAKEFHEVAGLAPLDLLMSLDLAHKRGRCVCAEETREDEISLHTGGVRNQGTIFPRKGAGDGGGIPKAYLC